MLSVGNAGGILHAERPARRLPWAARARSAATSSSPGRAFPRCCRTGRAPGLAARRLSAHGRARRQPARRAVPQGRRPPRPAPHGRAGRAAAQAGRPGRAAPPPAGRRGRRDRARPRPRTLAGMPVDELLPDPQGPRHAARPCWPGSSPTARSASCARPRCRTRRCPTRRWRGWPRSLPEELAELVVINQVRLLRRTSLLEALESEPAASTRTSSGRLRELRETLPHRRARRRPRRRRPPPPAPAPAARAGGRGGARGAARGRSRADRGRGDGALPDRGRAHETRRRSAPCSELYRLNTAREGDRGPQGHARGARHPGARPQPHGGHRRAGQPAADRGRDRVASRA